MHQARTGQCDLSGYIRMDILRTGQLHPGQDLHRKRPGERHDEKFGTGRPLRRHPVYDRRQGQSRRTMEKGPRNG